MSISDPEQLLTIVNEALQAETRIDIDELSLQLRVHSPRTGQLEIVRPQDCRDNEIAEESLLLLLWSVRSTEPGTDQPETLAHLCNKERAKSNELTKTIFPAS